MRAKITTVLIVTILAVIACTNKNEDKKELKIPVANEYMSQNLGGHMFLIEGQSVQNPVEMFVLHEKGMASWKLINVYSGGSSETQSDKTGPWRATSVSLSIDIKGNTGLINETFTKSGGKYKKALSHKLCL